MSIVQVVFEDRRNPGTFHGGAYSYLADQPVAVGDIVNVPTKYGERNAKIVKTDVPVGEIGCRVGQLNKIAGPAFCGNLFSGFFD
jgi:hypothetical protein